MEPSKKILLVFGTRPEAIKMCPLVLELARRPVFRPVVCVTGQHREMLDQVLECFGVVPDYDLAIMQPGQTLFDITTRILNGLRPILEQEKPDAVLVHGDTSTAFAAGLAAFYLQLPIGHVEAGLRTYNIASPFPEEFNRQAVDAFSHWYFAPTQTARQTLLQENKDPKKIFVTGNTSIDALHQTVRTGYTHPDLDWAKAGGARFVLLTAHRRENLGTPMRHIFQGIRRVLDEHPEVRVLYPIHKNPLVRQTAQEVFGDESRLRLIEPLDVLDFHNFMAAADLILTDSGGIQEEAPALGKPVLVLRDTTERPEGVAAGTLQLVGTTEEGVYTAFRTLLDDPAVYHRMSKAANPYGDGTASRQIADILQAELARKV